LHRKGSDEFVPVNRTGVQYPATIKRDAPRPNVASLQARAMSVASLQKAGL